jgi:hypothetical protein
MTLQLKKRTATRRTSTIWPFLLSATKEGVVQNIYDPLAAKMELSAATTPPRAKIPRKTPVRR